MSRPRTAATLALVTAAIVAAPSLAQDPPATDIYLFELGAVDGFKPSAPKNLTDRDGYDNQPHFLPDGSGLLYTSIRDGQADVYLYRLADGSTTRLTATPESEYSPTPMPGGKRFSTVRVEENGTQRLWSFALPPGGTPAREEGTPAGGTETGASGDPRLVLEEMEPVGYHAWLGPDRVALFVLGEPPSLWIAETASGGSRQVVESIGRALHRVPGRVAMSYVHKAGETDWQIVIFDPWLDRSRTIAATRPGSEDLTWTADGRILMGEGSRLFVLDPAAAKPGWTELADLGPLGVGPITRLAVSPDGRHLALVGGR